MQNLSLGLRIIQDSSYMEVKRQFSCCSAHYSMSTPQVGVAFIGKGFRKMRVKDMQQEEVFVIRRPIHWCSLPEVFVEVGDAPALLLKPKGYLSSSYFIIDENDQNVLRIKKLSNCFTDPDYKIFSQNDVQIGEIKGEKTEFDLKYPRDLGVRYKAALIAACMFFDNERQQEKNAFS
ncbi:uncharacterized protein LOC126374072 [Pectinophora gossypiella]|uniref:uncharacterized protein LOC126374072 n=1 Tax=Pectinophora gossypiella TaxID=13191 RepID=UPI00214EC0F6|nr:uncharacterized protein LOC126374072 [Pectinophora gossypiella]